MSIMPQPFDPALRRQTDPNASSSQIINKILAFQQQSNHKKQNNICTYISQCCKNKSQIARKIVQNLYVQIFITLLTIVSLFMEDIRIICIKTEYDIMIDIVNIVFIVLFMIEIMFSLAVPGYACSFFFYLDILSTLSIVMDISILTNLLYSSSQVSSGLQLSAIIKHSKASRAAARTVRVMKIFRLARIVKLYKSAVKAQQLKSKKNKQLMNQRLKSMKLKKIKQAQINQQNNASFRQIQSQCQSKNQIISKTSSKQFIMFSNKLVKDNQVSKNNIQSKTKLNTNKNIKQQLGNQRNNIDNKTVHKRISINKIDQIKIQQDLLAVECGKNEEDKNKEDEQNKHEQQEIASHISKTQSKISKLLSQNSMKKIILVILVLMFSVPVLEIDNYYPQTSAWDFLVNFISKSLLNPAIPISKINQLINKNIQGNKNSDQSTQQLIYFSTPFTQLYLFDANKLQTLRIGDLTIAQIQINITQVLSIRNNSLTIQQKFHEDQRDTITIILSCQQFNQIDSWFSISKILFICVIIIYLLNTFNENISQLITEPIQKMLEDVKNNGKSDTVQYTSNIKIQEVSQKKINYQTTNVHLALTKISNLLSKIFSHRGKQIIYTKIFQSGNVISNYLSQNKKMYCIVGLCSIQNYYSICDILKGDVMGLHNQIAQYLHSSVFRYGGRAVMNYQGSFLIVFQCPVEYQHLIKQQSHKFKSSKTNDKAIKSFNILYHKLQKPRKKMIGNNLYNNMGSINGNKIEKVVQNEQNNYLNIFTDFSVYAMVKTLVKISKQSKFYKYRKDARLAHAFNENFQVKINCMLHAGWVQQGFLGSTIKMDYCCFGKTINQLKKMAYFCHKLPSSIILSQNVYDISTFGMKRYCRILGNYVDKQKQIERKLYSVDLNLQNISPPKTMKIHKDDSNALILKKQLNFQYLKDPQQIKVYKASNFINAKKQLREVMRNVVSEQFKRKYTIAYEHYLCGEFAQSKQILDDLLAFSKDDSLVLRLNHLILSASKNQSVNNKYNIPIYDQQIQWLMW